MLGLPHTHEQTTGAGRDVDIDVGGACGACSRRIRASRLFCGTDIVTHWVWAQCED